MHRQNLLPYSGCVIFQPIENAVEPVFRNIAQVLRESNNQGFDGPVMKAKIGGRAYMFRMYADKFIVLMIDGKFYGYLTLHGKPCGKFRSSIEVVTDCETIDHDAGLYYKPISSRCKYCGRLLKDRQSVARGYGPTCARRRKLPWS